MKHDINKKILILGASGGCGRWLVRLAAERGYSVTALVREKSKLPPLPGVTIQYGDIFSKGVLEKVLTDQDIVISCLGLRRKNPRNPWSALLSPSNLTSRAIEKLIPLLKQFKINRLLVISAAGVAESFNQLSWPIQRLVKSGKIGIAYRDLATMESILESSDIDWMAVRPVTLIDGNPTNRGGIVHRYGLFSQIRRSDVASWMLDTVEKQKVFNLRYPMIGTVN